MPMDNYYKISVPGPQGYSFLVATGRNETEEAVLNATRAVDGAFDLEEDALNATAERIEIGDNQALASSFLFLDTE